MVRVFWILCPGNGAGDNERNKFSAVILRPGEGNVEESIEGSNEMSAGLEKRSAYGSFTLAGLGFRMTGLWVGGIA